MDNLNLFFRLRSVFFAKVANFSKTPKPMNTELYIKNLTDIVLEFQTKYIELFLGVVPENIQKAFEKATNSIGQPWDLSIFVFCINEGIASPLSLSTILPIDAYPEFLETWAQRNSYTGKDFKRGNILIWRPYLSKKYSVAYVSSVNRFNNTISCLMKSGEKLIAKEFKLNAFRFFKLTQVDMQKVYFSYFEMMRKASELAMNTLKAIKHES